MHIFVSNVLSDGQLKMRRRHHSPSINVGKTRGKAQECHKVGYLVIKGTQKTCNDFLNLVLESGSGKSRLGGVAGLFYLFVSFETWCCM